MDKQTAISKALDAAAVAVQAVNDYGLGSAEAGSALRIADRTLDQATALGATRDEITVARRSQGGPS